MDTIELKIFDETLRDGEQQAGLFFPFEAKRELAHEIASTGVHYIDIMPLIDESEERLVRTLVSEGLETVIAPATMTGKPFIDKAKSCGVRRIIMFHAISDRLMFLRDQEARRSRLLKNRTIDDGLPPSVMARVRNNAYEKILENVRYAVSPGMGLEVDFAAEDASRADRDFLIQCIRGLRPYVGHFMLCDTVGVLTPERTYRWVNELSQATEDAPLAVHFHNDLGMAVENSIQAVVAGASMVSGTFCGIGERAGNAALEQVLNGLRVRFGVEVAGIEYDRLETVASRVEQLGGTPARIYSKEARRHETGIHVNSFLRDPRSYSTFCFEEPEIWFGKCSGASNFQYLFENILGKEFTQEAYHQMRVRIKALSIQQERCFSSEEVIELYERGLLVDGEHEANGHSRQAMPEENQSNGAAAQRVLPRHGASQNGAGREVDPTDQVMPAANGHLVSSY